MRNMRYGMRNRLLKLQCPFPNERLNTFCFTDLRGGRTCLYSAHMLFYGNSILISAMPLWQGVAVNWNRYACSNFLPRLRLGYLHASSFFDADSPLFETAENDVFGAKLFQRFVNKQWQFCLGFFMRLPKWYVLALLCGYSALELPPVPKHLMNFLNMPHANKGGSRAHSQAACSFSGRWMGRRAAVSLLILTD